VFFRDCCFLCVCLHYPTPIPLDWTTQAIGQQHTSPLRAKIPLRRKPKTPPRKNLGARSRCFCCLSRSRGVKIEKPSKHSPTQREAPRRKLRSTRCRPVAKIKIPFIDLAIAAVAPTTSTYAATRTARLATATRCTSKTGRGLPERPDLELGRDSSAAAPWRPTSSSTPFATRALPTARPLLPWRRCRRRSFHSPTLQPRPPWPRRARRDGRRSRRPPRHKAAKA